MYVLNVIVNGLWLLIFVKDYERGDRELQVMISALNTDNFPGVSQH